MLKSTSFAEHRNPYSHRVLCVCIRKCFNMFVLHRPTSRSSGTNQNSNGGVSLPAGLADDQSKDFDFEKTEMKYDSTGMFHWSPARNLEDCILVSFLQLLYTSPLKRCGHMSIDLRTIYKKASVYFQSDR